MNKDNAKEFLPLVQALADGKTIQIRSIDKWCELDDFTFNRPIDRYRIKPEPREFFACIEDGTIWDLEIQANIACGQFQSKPVRVREIL